MTASESLAWESQSVKRELEAGIQDRILDPILGRGRAFAFVTLDLELTWNQRKSARSGLGESSRSKAKEGDSRAEQSQRAISGKSEVEFVGRTQWLAKRVLVTVIHDETLPAAPLAAVRKTLAAAYPEWGLDADEIVFKPTRFQGREAASFLDFRWLFLGLLGIGLAFARRRQAAPAEPEGSGDEAGFSPRPLVAPALVAGLLTVIVWRSEGAAGLRPFLNLEALAVVLAGTLGIVGASHPLRSFMRAVSQSLREDPSREHERWSSSELLSTGARAAVTSGLIGTALGVILLLASIDDVAMIPRRLALALSAGFYGLLLSEFILAPMARRLAPAARGPADAAGPRQAMGAASVGLALLALFVILFALSAPLVR